MHLSCGRRRSRCANSLTRKVKTLAWKENAGMAIVQEQRDAHFCTIRCQLVRRLHGILQRIQKQEAECDRLRDVQSGRMVWSLSNSKHRLLTPFLTEILLVLRRM